MYKLFKIILMIIVVQIAFNGFASENQRKALIVGCIGHLPAVLPTIHTRTAMQAFMTGFFNHANDEIKECINNSCLYSNQHFNDYPALQLNEALQTMVEIKEENNPANSIDSLKDALEDMILQMLLYDKGLPQ